MSLARRLAQRIAAAPADGARILGHAGRLLGTTISPYLFFCQSAQEVEDQPRRAKGRSANAPEQADRQLRRTRIETTVGMAESNGMAFFIILTAALTLHAHGADRH